MMLVVLIAGIGLLLAGLATVGLGIELDLSFGNTLILAGAIVTCTGVLMLGLWIAVRELKAIAWQLSGLPAPSQEANTPRSASSSAAPGDEALEQGGMLFSRDRQAMEPAPAAESGSSAAPPWREETVSRQRGEAPEAPPAAKPRRNLLFSSSRKERERAQAQDPFAADPLAGAPPEAESNPASPATFDDAWPRPERVRAAATPRRAGRAPSAFAEPDGGVAGAADQTASAAHGGERAPVTILKSGVVDGMAYSLYSDGSIEAQMPEGMMRFASIDELRAHLDQRP